MRPPAHRPPADRKGPVRIGVIGLGRFGRLHLKAFERIAQAEVVALADVNREALDEAGELWGVSPRDRHIDPEALISRPDIDAVDIVSDEQTHGALVLAALAAGKHVIVEKPLAVSVQEASAIKREAEKAGLLVLVGNISRFCQPYYAIKRAIEDGRLGRVGAIRTKRNFSKSWFDSFGKRVHPVYESGIHELDLLIWYAGARCVEVSAFERYMSGYPYPDLFAALLRFDNGIVASLDSSWLVPAGAPGNLAGALELTGTIDAHIEVNGELGTAQYRLAHDGLSLWGRDGVAHPDAVLWPEEIGGVGGAIRAELTHFAEAIASGEPSPVMPLGDAVHAMKIADAIVRAAATGEVVRLSDGRR